jgi:hypothetical protein
MIHALLVVCGFGQVESAAPFEPVAEPATIITQMLADLSKNDRLWKTWQGTCRVTQTELAPRWGLHTANPELAATESTVKSLLDCPCLVTHTALVRYWEDLADQCVKSEWITERPLRIVETETGRSSVDERVTNRVSLQTRDFFADFNRLGRMVHHEDMPTLPGADQVRRMAVLDTPVNGANLAKFGTFFRPGDLRHLGGMPHSILLEKHLRALTSGSGGDGPTLQQGVVNGSPTIHLTTRFLLGRNQGTVDVVETYRRETRWCLVRATSTMVDSSGAHRIDFEQEWDWRMAGQVAVPFQYVYRKYETIESQLVFERIVEFLESRVNEPLPRENFQLESFDFQEGDLVHDRRTKRVTIWADGQLRPVEEVLPMPITAARPNTHQAWLILLYGNLAIFGLAIGIMIYRIRRRRTR